MNKIIKAVSRDNLCVAKRWRQKMWYVLINIVPTFYVNYVFNLNDA